jgi:hypothetical protein
MIVIFESGYILFSGDEFLTYVRIVHSLNWFFGGAVMVFSTVSGYDADVSFNTLIYE